MKICSIYNIRACVGGRLVSLHLLLVKFANTGTGTLPDGMVQTSS